MRAVVRFAGYALLMLGGVMAVGCLVMIPILPAMDAPCPPGATCDGVAMMTVFCLIGAALGASGAGVGGIALWFTRTRKG